MFTEQRNGQWTAPAQLTNNNHWEGEQVDYPPVSGDGRAVIYWLVRSQGGVLDTMALFTSGGRA